MWQRALVSLGLPVSDIQVVSLAPHAPRSIEDKVQAQLLIVQHMSSTRGEEGARSMRASGRARVVPLPYKSVKRESEGAQWIVGGVGAMTMVGTVGLLLLRAHRQAAALNSATYFSSSRPLSDE